MKIGILGCNGKIGKQLLKTLYYNNPSCLAGCLESSYSPILGQDVATLINAEPLGIYVTDNASEVFSKSDVLIDFTNNIAAEEHAILAAKFNKPIVIGTTGFTDNQDLVIKKLSKEIPIVKSSNMSIGVNILFRIVEYAAKVLDKELYDIEIIEKHHKSKIDAPSGTALTIGNLISKARKESLSNITHSQRKGITKGREPNKIAFHSIRGGNIIGEHSVLFIGDGDILELKHTSISREIFISGAIKAAKWVINKPNGLYSFNEIINNISEE